MSASMPTFHHHLSPPFVDALRHLVKSQHGQWWRDVLVHRDLFLAVRDDSLNVYHRGGSIFRIVLESGAVVPATHVKYLVRQRQAYATMGADGTFMHEAKDALWSAYQGQATLNEMISAAKSLAGPEKTGLHALIMAHPKVIDVEVSLRSAAAEAPSLPLGDSADDIHVLADQPEPLSRANLSSSADAGLRQDRLDAVTIEDRAGALWIVFHEAKHFANTELRAGPGRAPLVGAQMARYREAIKHYKTDMAESYREVCQALVQLHMMRGLAQQAGSSTASSSPLPLDSLIERAAGGELLHVDTEPRLIVFGFDKDQKDGPTWRPHRDRLVGELGLTVYALGDPKASGSAAFQKGFLK